MTDRYAHPPRLAFAAADLAAAGIAAFAAYAIRFHTGLAPVEGRTDVLASSYLQALPAVCLAGLAATTLAGLHDRRRLALAPRAADAIRASALLGGVLAILALVWWKEFQYSRLAIAIGAVVFAPLLILLRRAAIAALTAAHRSPRFRTPALVIGGGRPLASLADALAQSEWKAIDVVGALVPEGETCPWPAAHRCQDLADAAGMLRRAAAREVFIALPADRSNELTGLLTALEQTTADVRVVPDLGDAVLVNPGLLFVGRLPVLTARESPLYGARAALKRCVDVALALLLLVVLSPAFVVCALAVKLGSRGSVLFSQERMGLDGRAFRMWKFRTMRPDAEAVSGPVFATRDDPRVSTVGRFLRRFSLDELPQLWNVLRGDMSLVGPRPERAPFIEEFRRRLPGYMLRHTVKAGMTGWAQVHGFRGESSLEQRLRYDLEYIERWTLSLDLEILGRTAVQVIVGRNAY